MNAHRSRSLGTAALIFILISLTAAVFHGAAPVRAEDVTAPDPIEIDEKTANVTVKLYADENRTQELSGPVTSASHFYGAFSAKFLNGKGPSAGNNVAEYKFPDTIVVDNNNGGELLAGTETDQVKAGMWKIEGNKVIFTFDESWLANNPADIFVGANFSFELADKNSGSGSSTSVVFPGDVTIKIDTKDGNVTGTKSGTFSQGSDGVAKVTWTVKLTVESYATNVKFTDTLGENFSFVEDSFMLDDKKLDPQPTISGQVATLDSLSDLTLGDHTITYETELKRGVSASNGEYINGQDGSKNTAMWEWGGVSNRQNGSVTAAPGQFRYDMINKSNGSGKPSDITWTVTLNQGELKTDMSGYVFTDTLDDKQTYTGSYTIYKGSSGSDVFASPVTLDSTQSSFTYTFPTDLADKYATYRIVYHTRMNDTSSYDTVRNDASISHGNSVSGTDDGAFTPQLVGTPITKRLVSSDNAAETGTATWETRVALKAIVNAVNPGKVTVKDTFQAAWKQNIGVDADSIVITIGDMKLVRDTDWKLTNNQQGVSNKRNFDLDIIVNDRVKNALKDEDYAFIRYDTKSDALPGWYSNFASVSADGLNLQRQYSDPIVYVINQETTPSVEKPENEAIVSWDGDFEWNDVDGTSEKGAWIVDWTVYANRVVTSEGECYGAGRLNRQPLKITDKLPDGMSYVSGSAMYSLFQNPYDKHTSYFDGDKNVTVADGVTLAADGVNSTGSTVTFSIPTTGLGDYAGYAKLTYQTAVKRGQLDTSRNEVKFTNSASAESGDKKFESGSGTVTIKNNVIKKTGEQANDSNRIKYTILVNESAVALKSGTGFLELVDTMDAKCTLVPSSLKVYECVDGNWSSLAEKNYSSKMEQISDETGSRTKLTLNVPDGKYLKVEYEVIPSGNVGDKVSLSNTAKLTGVTEGSATDEHTWTVKSASASAGGNGYGIMMTKYDAQQVGATLKDAGFTLYEVDMNQTKRVFETAVTDANGNISFGAENKAMSNCVLYQLVETKAPEGYAPAKPTWIMLKGEATDGEYQSALNKAKTIAGNAEIIGDAKKYDIWIYDNRLTGSATIQAKKVLEGGTFKAGQFSFELKDSDGRVLQTATNNDEGNVSFDVEYNKAGTYTYAISEVVPEGAENNVKDHITYDITKHNVTVKVTNGAEQLDTVVTYDDDSQDPPTFTNKYSTTLPEAGGAGLTMTYLAGASLLCFAATWMHARRHRDMDRGGRRE